MVNDKLRTVDSRIDPFMRAFDFLPQRFRIHIESSLLGWDEFVKGGVKDAENLGRFVVNDLGGFLIEENRDGEPI
jgi:hypothetical protein